MRCWNVFYWKQPQQLAQQVAFVTTERIRVANLACRDMVALGRAPYTNWIGRMQEEDEAIVMQALEKVGMADYAFRTMDKMSDGECQRDTPLIHYRYYLRHLQLSGLICNNHVSFTPTVRGIVRRVVYTE